MSRRKRAVGFACAAAICAGLAAGATGGARSELAAELGELREVVVASRALPARRPLGRAVVERALETRRVPERFVAPDALASPAEALGRRPAAPIPPGGYLVASQFEPAGGGGEAARPQLGPGRRPVEIAVAGAGALASSSGAGPRRVDVVVTTEATPGGGAGRTFVAAHAVGLLELRPGAAGATGQVLDDAATESWVATLALTRPQALRLIHAQSFAREVRLIGR